MSFNKCIHSDTQGCECFDQPTCKMPNWPTRISLHPCWSQVNYLSWSFHQSTPDGNCKSWAGESDQKPCSEVSIGPSADNRGHPMPELSERQHGVLGKRTDSGVRLHKSQPACHLPMPQFPLLVKEIRDTYLLRNS